jgi:hypothetical protein
MTNGYTMCDILDKSPVREETTCQKERQMGRKWNKMAQGCETLVQLNWLENGVLMVTAETSDSIRNCFTPSALLFFSFLHFLYLLLRFPLFSRQFLSTVVAFFSILRITK